MFQIKEDPNPDQNQADNVGHGNIPSASTAVAVAAPAPHNLLNLQSNCEGEGFWNQPSQPLKLKNRHRKRKRKKGPIPVDRSPSADSELEQSLFSDLIQSSSDSESELDPLFADLIQFDDADNGNKLSSKLHLRIKCSNLIYSNLFISSPRTRNKRFNKKLSGSIEFKLQRGFCHLFLNSESLCQISIKSIIGVKLLRYEFDGELIKNKQNFDFFYIKYEEPDQYLRFDVINKLLENGAKNLTDPNADYSADIGNISDINDAYLRIRCTKLLKINKIKMLQNVLGDKFEYLVCKYKKDKEEFESPTPTYIKSIFETSARFQFKCFSIKFGTWTCDLDNSVVIEPHEYFNPGMVTLRITINDYGKSHLLIIRSKSWSKCVLKTTDAEYGENSWDLSFLIQKQWTHNETEDRQRILKVLKKLSTYNKCQDDPFEPITKTKDDDKKAWINLSVSSKSTNERDSDISSIKKIFKDNKKFEFANEPMKISLKFENLRCLNVLYKNFIIDQKQKIFLSISHEFVNIQVKSFDALEVIPLFELKIPISEISQCKIYVNEADDHLIYFQIKSKEILEKAFENFEQSMYIKMHENIISDLLGENNLKITTSFIGHEKRKIFKCYFENFIYEKFKHFKPIGFKLDSKKPKFQFRCLKIQFGTYLFTGQNKIDVGLTSDSKPETMITLLRPGLTTIRIKCRRYERDLNYILSQQGKYLYLFIQNKVFQDDKIEALNLKEFYDPKGNDPNKWYIVLVLDQKTSKCKLNEAFDYLKIFLEKSNHLHVGVENDPAVPKIPEPTNI